MQTYNQNAFPPGIVEEEPLELKKAQDVYNIYVNGEYIGQKFLMTEAEKLDDLLDFLQKEGIEHVSAQLDGDHYIINTNESERVKQILQVYLQNR